MALRTLLKLTDKRYLKLKKISWNSSTNITQSYLTLVKFDPQALLKQTHKRYSKFLKIIRNRSTHVTQIDPKTLLETT